LTQKKRKDFGKVHGIEQGYLRKDGLKMVITKPTKENPLGTLLLFRNGKRVNSNDS
jgi:hypothetical protein